MAENKKQNTLLHKRSVKKGVLPQGEILQYGEIAVNYNSEEPFLSIRKEGENKEYAKFIDEKAIEAKIEKAKDSPIILGEAEYSAVLKGEYEGYSNKAISPTSMAVGGASNAGLKGWYYSGIDFTNNKIYLSRTQPNSIKTSGFTTDTSITLEDIQGPEEGLITKKRTQYVAGDSISIVCDAKYENKCKITSVEPGIITVDKIPFTSDVLPSYTLGIGKQPDDFTLYSVIPEINSITKQLTVRNWYQGGIDLGAASFAEGANTYSTNIASHAEGLQTVAYGQYSHTEGFGTKAGYAAHAEGRDSEAIGTMSHAEGQSTLAIGSKSHTEGTQTETHANNSHAEGYKSIVKDGAGAHAEGYGSVIDFTESTEPSDIPSNANREQSIGAHVEGVNNTAAGIAVHVEGKNNKANQTASHAEGFNTRAGVFEISNENTTSTEGMFTHAEGNSTLARGSASHAEGAATQSLGRASHAEGRHSVAKGNYSHAEGFDTFAGSNGGNLLPSITNTTRGYFTHAEGHNTLAEGNSSHAEGKGSKAIGDVSHAEGYNTLAQANYSHTEGYNTFAQGNYSHTEGYDTLTKGNYSHAEGYNTITYNEAEHASGRYNKSTKSADTSQATQFSIGIGASGTARKNAFEVKQNGDIYIEGVEGRIQDKLNEISQINKTIEENEEVVATALTTLDGRINEIESKQEKVFIMPEDFIEEQYNEPDENGYIGKVKQEYVTDLLENRYTRFMLNDITADNISQSYIVYEDETIDITYIMNNIASYLVKFVINTNTCLVSTESTHGYNPFTYTSGLGDFDETQPGVVNLRFLDQVTQDNVRLPEENKQLFKKNMGSFADWNAQEGETGYIENRTHYINTKEGIEYTLSELDYIDINEDGGKEWYYHGGLYNYGIALKDSYGVLKYIDITSKEEVLFKDTDDPTIALTVKQVIDEEEDDSTIVFRAEYSGFNNFKFLLFENVDNPIVTLDPQYIPYTIARKSDLENVGRADWNAKKGEAGYIENKPFTYYDTIYNLSDGIITDESIYDDDGIAVSNRVGIEYTYGITVFKEATNKIDDSFRITAYQEVGPYRERYAYNCFIETIEKFSRYKLIIELESGEVYYDDWKFAYNEDLNIKPISDIFIPNTVIKTTPQELSEDDKKQVKENLGLHDAMLNVTYLELKSLRDNLQLIPGQQYRITDYVTTTIQENTRIAEEYHPFDIIVIADDINVLNENARAIQHLGDTYFANSDLNAWELKYCLDNDTDRFVWADATNGKGIIYRMKDEWGNECSYDFKNIQFARWELSNPVGYKKNASNEWVEDSGVTETYGPLKVGFYAIDNTKNEFDFGYSKFNIVYTISSEPTYCYTFGKDSDYSLTGENYDNVIKSFSMGGSILLNHIVFLGNNCFNNTFGNSCIYNTFGNNCYHNTFGIGCHSNTFGNYCTTNTFGNDCSSNTFRNNCYDNTFGNDCSSNTFGYGCYENTFGYGCYSNTFGNSCDSNTFGNSCDSNTFGNNCYHNTFGNRCDSNTFGTSASESGELKDYCSYNHIEDGVNCVNIWNALESNGSNQLKNIRVKMGVCGTSSERLHINVIELGMSWEWIVASNTKGEIKQYCEADLIA